MAWCVHKNPSFDPILSQMNPVHILTSCFLKIHFNIILPSTPSSTKWPYSFTFSDQYFVHAFLMSPMRSACSYSASCHTYSRHYSKSRSVSTHKLHLLVCVVFSADSIESATQCREQSVCDDSFIYLRFELGNPSLSCRDDNEIATRSMKQHIERL